MSKIANYGLIILTMESIWHGALKCSANIFQYKMEFYIGEGPPWENKSRLMLNWWEYIDLIIARETIHKWKDDTSSTVVDNLIDVWGGGIVIRTSPIQIKKINVNPNSTLLFIDKDYISVKGTG